MLLTDEEMLKAWNSDQSGDTHNCKPNFIALCKAQHQKDIEWLEEPCTEHFKNEPPSWRRLCPLCWKEFKEL